MMLGNDVEQPLSVGCRCIQHVDQLGIHTLVERAVVIVNIRNATRHTGSKVAPCSAQHHHPATSHVFTAVVTNTFHNSGGPRVSNTESLANKTIDKDLAGCRPVTNYVSCNHVLFRCKCCAVAWPQHYFSTRKTLAQIVIRVTEQRQ